MNRIHPSARRTLGISLCSMLFGILLAMLGGSLYIRHLFAGIQYTNPVTAPIHTQTELYPSAPETLPQGSAETLPPQPTEAENPRISILLIGQDRWEGEAISRSDSMILCTFDTDRKTITLTSFLRDLYVKIPGYQRNRLNAAYAFGGTQLLNQTLEENFGIRIDGNLEVDFSRFSSVIDILGGVEISLRQDEADYLGEQLTEGPQLLSGPQALAYARIRRLDSDGDFSRTERQRKLLTSLMESCRSASLPTMLRLAKEVFPLLTTDLTREELLTLARQMLPMLSSAQIISQHIPTEGTYTYETIDGMAVLVPDLDAARKHLEDTLHADDA